MLWIVQSSIMQLGERVDRHVTIPAPTAPEAANVVRKTMGGKVSTVGYTIGGMVHYFPQAT
jgi:hypothetical protein